MLHFSVCLFVFPHSGADGAGLRWQPLSDHQIFQVEGAKPEFRQGEVSTHTRVQHQCCLYANVCATVQLYLMPSTEEITLTSKKLKQGKLEAATEMKRD